MANNSSQLRIVIAIDDSRANQKKPNIIRIRNYHADTAEVTTTTWPRGQANGPYFEGCHFPTVDNLDSQAYTVLAYTTDEYYLAVNIRGETNWFSKDELLNRPVQFTNISIANQEILKHGWISTQTPTDLDITPIIHFKKCLSRVSTLANGNIGTYMFCPDGGIILKSASHVSSENLIVLPGVTQIKAKALQFNNSIRHITLPASITKIEPGAFQRCERLEEINIPYGVTGIGERTFYSCTAIHKINIPEGVTTIGSMAFANCNELESITLPSKLETITYKAFTGCTKLSEITIPSRCRRIDESAFTGCNNIKNIYISRPAWSIPGSPWGAPSDCTVHWSESVKAGNSEGKE